MNIFEGPLFPLYRHYMVWTWLSFAEFLLLGGIQYFQGATTPPMSQQRSSKILAI